jgi:hypothetical protein
MSMVSEELKTELRDLTDRIVRGHGETETVRELLDRAMWMEFRTRFDDASKNEAHVITPHDEASVIGRLIERLTNKKERLAAEVY